ncbi:MAG: site-2 protease family protein [Armatimonadota bacterium]|nr:site-2 protease family protein [Armatimonadota bacterium]MDR7457716.1 site-2 protease family protein [Armatimonadota bacterium]MDR7510971.1 site-2 protease family protein [Armatimonadota bacterium]
MRGRRWLQAVGVLAGTVLVHEIAHAVAARRAGGEVREVGLGFGPPLARRRVADVDVTLRAIPLGGFAAIDVERLPPARRIPVLLAGPLANVAVGLALRLLAGRAGPTTLPGQTRRVEVGGMLAALAMLTQASARGPASLLRAAGDVNLSVGLANLVPAVPLDGGHLAAAQLEALGAGRGVIAAFRQVSAALFVSFALRVLLADLARLRGTPGEPGRGPA